MEVKEPAWLNEKHPNYERWKRGREVFIERGKFAVSVIEQYKICKGLTILDLGSGEGGTAGFLSIKNKVISADISLIRLKRQSTFRYLDKINLDAGFLPFKKKIFDLIILQDVIEHIPANKEILLSLADYLKWDGMIYLSTPNRLSLFNVIADPHWGLPVISLLKREQIQKHFLKRFRRKDAERKDIAELLDLKIIGYFNSKYNPHLNTVYALKELLDGHNGIVWSNFHLALIRVIRTFKLQKLILKTANDRWGFVNKYLTPTFYMILEKKKP